MAPTSYLPYANRSHKCRMLVLLYATAGKGTLGPVLCGMPTTLKYLV
jgi:hypothetical protein